MANEDLLKIKKTQETLKAQLKLLEKGISAPKAYAFQTEELRDMVNTLIAQNKRLAEKIDYLLSVIVEASAEVPEERTEKLLAAMAASQLDAMDQLSAVLKEVKSPKARIEKLEKMHAQTSERLEALTENVSHLSQAQQVNDLRKEVEIISDQIKQLGQVVTTEEPALRTAMQSIRSEIVDLKSKVEEKSTQAKIIEVESKLSELEAMLKQKMIMPSISKEEMEKIRELTEKLFALTSEMEKIKRFTETYPATEAQNIDLIRKKLTELEEDLKSLKESPQQAAMLQELTVLRLAITNIRNMLQEKGVSPAQLELETITAKLKELEEELKKTSIEEVPELKKEIAEIREELEKAKTKPVKPEVVSSIKEMIKKIEIPVLKEKPEKMKEKTVETKKLIEKVKAQTKTMLVKEEDLIAKYVSSLSVEKPITLATISTNLRLDLKNVERILIQMQKENPEKISLHNIDYVSKLAGKEAILIKRS